MRTGDFEAGKNTAIASVSFTLASKNAIDDAGVWELFSHAKAQFLAARTALLRSLNSSPSSRACAGDTAGCSHITLAAAIRRTRIRPLNVVIKAEAHAKEAQAPAEAHHDG